MDMDGDCQFAYSLLIQQDGKIIVAGNSHSGSSDYDFALARLTSAGNLDSFFGTGGKVTTDFASDSADACKSIAIHADGKILLVGASNGACAVARYWP